MEQRTELLKRKKSKQTKHFVSKTFSRENYSKSLSKYCFYFSDFIKKKIWLIIPRKVHTQNCTKCGIFLNTNIKEITFNEEISYCKGHYLLN